MGDLLGQTYLQKCAWNIRTLNHGATLVGFSQAVAKTSSPFFHAYCPSTAHSSDSTHTVPRLCYKHCKNIRLLHWCDKSPHWQEQLKAEAKHWLCWATEKQNLPPSVAVAEPNRWLLQEGSHVLQAADSCSFSRKADVAHSLSNPTAASPPLHLCLAPAGQQSGAFLAVTSHLIFFFASSQSQDAVRNVNGFCFFMLSPHVLLSSEAKWNGSAFSWSPKVLSTGMQEKMQLFQRAGRAALGLHACSDPNLDKTAHQTRLWDCSYFSKQNIGTLCTRRTNTSLMHTLVDGKLSHQSQLAQIWYKIQESLCGTLGAQRVWQKKLLEMKHEGGRRATENEYFLHRLCGKAPRKFSGSADVVFPNSSIFIGRENSPNLTKRKYEMKSHKGNSILVLFIPAFLFLFFFFFHSTYSGLFCTSGNHKRNQELLSSTREEQGAQETGSAHWCDQCWALRKGNGTETPGPLQSTFHVLGILEAPLLMRLQTHSTKCQFSERSRLGRAFEQI